MGLPNSKHTILMLQVAGSVCRVREMLLGLADRLDGAANATLPKDNLHPKAVEPPASASPPLPPNIHGSGTIAASLPVWLHIGGCCGAAGGSHTPLEIPVPAPAACTPHHSEAAAAFAQGPGAHWAVLQCANSTGCAGSTGSTCPAPGQDGPWPPSFDLRCLHGLRQVEWGQRVLSALEPLASLLSSPGSTQLPASSPQAPSSGSTGAAAGAAAAGGQGGGPQKRAGAAEGWAAGRQVAKLLRDMCEGRLLPTPWLDKVGYNPR